MVYKCFFKQNIEKIENSQSNSICFVDTNYLSGSPPKCTLNLKNRICIERHLLKYFDEQLSVISTREIHMQQG